VLSVDVGLLARTGNAGFMPLESDLDNAPAEGDGDGGISVFIAVVSDDSSVAITGQAVATLNWTVGIFAFTGL